MLYVLPLHRKVRASSICAFSAAILSTDLGGRWEAFDEDGNQQVEQYVVAERHERDEVQRRPRRCLGHAFVQHLVPILLSQYLHWHRRRIIIINSNNGYNHCVSRRTRPLLLQRSRSATNAVISYNSDATGVRPTVVRPFDAQKSPDRTGVARESRGGRIAAGVKVREARGLSNSISPLIESIKCYFMPK